jgi:hypothetical protein
MTVNPIVVPRLDQPTNMWSGIWIAEDIQLILQGVESRNWVDYTLGGVAAGLDALAFVSDPVSSLLQYGISWLIEHVRPLTEALEWLAGDPAAIAAHAQTWRNIAMTVRAEGLALADAVQADIVDWHGPAAEAYRAWSREQQGALTALADAGDTMALITEGAGFLIAGVRVLVRDAIAIAVSRIIVYAVELIASGLLATPLVIEQVTTTVAACVGKIARWLKPLIASLRNLVPVAGRLGQRIDELEEILERLSKGPGEAVGGAPRRYPAIADPSMEKGPLGDDFRPDTVVDPKDVFVPKERAVADRLTEEGFQVHAREANHAQDSVSQPDAMIRSSPDDPGRIAEFKTLDSNDSTAVRREIVVAQGQLAQHGGGVAVIDGRVAGLSEEEARRGFARAFGQQAKHGKAMPDEVLIILGDGSMLRLPDR